MMINSKRLYDYLAMIKHDEKTNISEIKRESFRKGEGLSYSYVHMVTKKLHETGFIYAENVGRTKYIRILNDGKILRSLLIPFSEAGIDLTRIQAILDAIKNNKVKNAMEITRACKGKVAYLFVMKNIKILENQHYVRKNGKYYELTPNGELFYEYLSVLTEVW